MAILLEGDGFRIRHFRPDDAARLLAVTTDPAVMRHVGDGSLLDAGKVALWIERSQANYRAFGYGSFALADPADDALFGWGGFIPPRESPLPELIYGFEQARWGQGLGRQVAAGLVGLARDRFRFAEVLATVDDTNRRSWHILEGLGFRLDRVVPEDGVDVRHYVLQCGKRGG